MTFREPFAGRPFAAELLWARIATATLAAISAVFVLYSDTLVALLGAFGWSTFAAALVPTVAIGFNWKRATAPAAITAILAGLTLNFVPKFYPTLIPESHGFHAGALAILVALVLFFFVSLVTRPPELEADVQRILEI